MILHALLFGNVAKTAYICSDNYKGRHLNYILIYKSTNNMETFALKSKKVVLPTATLREMKPGMSLKLPTKAVKTTTLRMTASKLKKEGYLFRVSDKGLINETIVECLKTPVL